MTGMFFRSIRVVVLVAVVSLVTSNTARAELLFYDGFDYSTGLNSGNDGGTGFDAAWSDSGSKQMEVASGSKGYTDAKGNVLDTVGNHLLLVDSNGRSGGKRPFDLFSIDQNLLNDNGNLGKDGTTLWMSFVMQSENSIANSAGWAGITLNNTGGSQSGVIDLGHKQITQINGQAEANFGMGMGWGGSSPVPPQVQSDVPLTQQSLLVFRMDFLAYDANTQTGADEVRMWVNPLLNETPSDSESLFLEFRWQDDSLEPSMEINGFALQQGPTDQQGQVFDEIRIGTTFADVTPFAAAPGVPGDYNGNGTVDAADYTLWLDSLGQSGAGLPADGDGSGTVDSADYDYWKTRFGNTSGSGLASGANVPEPGSVLIACVIAIAAGAWRCRVKAQ